MVSYSLKRGLVAGLVAYLAGALPLAAAAARSPANFRAEKRADDAVVAGDNICDRVRCPGGTVCQPSGDGKKASCVKEPAEGLCGTIACPPGTRCCNPLMGICVKPGNLCTLGAAEAKREETPAPPAEAVDPRRRCGSVICAPGTTCCNPLMNICVKPGYACPLGAAEEKRDETPAAAPAEAVEAKEKCGAVTCEPGTTCCNSSCGICVKPGGGCTKQFCLDGNGPACGKSKCSLGMVCCNSSCGICTPPGGMCTQQFCEDKTRP